MFVQRVVVADSRRESSPSTRSPARPTSPAPGSTTSPTYAPRSNGYDNASGSLVDGPCPTTSAPPTPPYNAASSSPPSASGTWRPTTSAYAGH